MTLFGTKSIDSPTLVDFKGDVLTVAAATPLPQGSRVQFALPLSKQGPPLSINGKVATFTKVKDGTFHIVLRCHSIPKDDRNAILDELTSA